VAAFDAVVICTAHEEVDYQQLADWSGCVIDTRNVMAGVNGCRANVWKA
jgi:UDP-N-acetyl-D-glucosamine dehydrogenase